MKKRSTAWFLTSCRFCSPMVPMAGAADAQTTIEAVYLGVQHYGQANLEGNPNKPNKSTLSHRFYVMKDGRERSYAVFSGHNFTIQNTLQEGYIYDLSVSGSTIMAAKIRCDGMSGTVTAINRNSIWVDGKKFQTNAAAKSTQITTAAGGAIVTSNPHVNTSDTVRVFADEENRIQQLFKAPVAKGYTPPISGVPGKSTLKNFIATALEPVGTALYIYGGAWDWQDVGSSNQSTTIGLPQSWIDFFQSQDATYTYKNSGDDSHSYYPNGGWNQYYYAGVDCSGYIGWTLYNLINTESGQSGYVGSATEFAWALANRGWGAWTQDFRVPVHHVTSDFHVGDIFSMDCHVWICLGTCDDGSIVIMHSTPSASKRGQPGGGIQISALNPKDTGKDCEAYRLAAQCMTVYYPAWSTRYDVVLKDYSDYTSFHSTHAGKFTWELTHSGLIADPDGYANMTPTQILADLFHPTYGGFPDSSGYEPQHGHNNRCAHR